MIVADTSVWIDHIRDRPAPAARTLQSLIGQAPILVGDLILHELLAGVHNEVEAEKLAANLTAYDYADMGGQDVAVEAARIYRALRGRGVTIGKTVDLFIGTFCILHGHTLLQRDHDFLLMQPFGLRLWPA